MWLLLLRYFISIAFSLFLSGASLFQISIPYDAVITNTLSINLFYNIHSKQFTLLQTFFYHLHFNTLLSFTLSFSLLLHTFPNFSSSCPKISSDSATSAVSAINSSRLKFYSLSSTFTRFKPLPNFFAFTSFTISFI